MFTVSSGIAPQLPLVSRYEMRQVPERLSRLHAVNGSLAPLQPTTPVAMATARAANRRDVPQGFERGVRLAIVSSRRSSCS